MKATPPLRPRAREAQQMMSEEIANVGGGYVDTVVRTDQPRAEAKELDWWYSGRVEEEGSITARSLAYLRAYLRIAGNGQLHAAGLLLDQGRVHMDKYVIRRLHKDGYLDFEPGSLSPFFFLTAAGEKLIQQDG